MAPGSTQPLTEMSTRSQLSRQCGTLVSQPYGPLWPFTGIPLPFFVSYVDPLFQFHILLIQP
jgi:hypothetical protein